MIENEKGWYPLKLLGFKVISLFFSIPGTTYMSLYVGYFLLFAELDNTNDLSISCGFEWFLSGVFHVKSHQTTH